MFDIQNNQVKLNLDDLGVPPFKDYYNNSKNKQKALKEIEYIVWLYKWNSPYEAYSREQRPKIIARDVFGDENYELSKEAKELIKRFIEFQETCATRLLLTSKDTADSINDTLLKYSKETLDIDTAIKVTKVLKDVGNIVKSLDIATKQAKAEQLEQGRVKGGGTIGLYEKV